MVYNPPTFYLNLSVRERPLAPKITRTKYKSSGELKYSWTPSQEYICLFMRYPTNLVSTSFGVIATRLGFLDRVIAFPQIGSGTNQCGTFCDGAVGRDAGVRIERAHD